MGLSKAACLRLQALRCREVSKGMDDSEIVRMLARMAYEFEQRAAILEPD